MSQTTDAPSQDIARGVLESLSEPDVVLSIPGTEYKLALKLSGPADRIRAVVGKRIKGTIQARALRMFKAKGGGRFIEPVWGEPRIVAGFILAVDQPNRRVLVDVAVPMWMTFDARQPPDAFNVGDLVNCYVESGTTFAPI